MVARYALAVKGVEGMPRPKRTASPRLSITIRFPPHVYAQLLAMAAESRRSMNEQAVVCIEQAAARQVPSSEPPAQPQAP